MFPPQRMHIYCATDEAHSAILRDKTDQLARLSRSNSVHLISASEAIKEATDLKDGNRKELLETEDDIDAANIIKHLDSLWLGHVLIHLPSTPSTQDVLKDTVRWCNAGWVAITGNQTAGRGRRGTSWTSPFGSVAISIALRINAAESEKLTFMQYIAALAAVDMVEMPGWEDVRLQVKWPNDIYKDGQKVGGVLCEGALRGGVFEIVVGIGVNVINEAPTTCLVRGGAPALREKFVGNYLTAFEKLYEQFCERGFEGSLMEQYVKAWMHTDQVVRLGGLDGPEAVVKGLAPNGWVRVFREDMQAFQDLPPGETSLDVVHSVMKKKVDDLSSQK